MVDKKEETLEVCDQGTRSEGHFQDKDCYVHNASGSSNRTREFSGASFRSLPTPFIIHRNSIFGFLVSHRIALDTL